MFVTRKAKARGGVLLALPLIVVSGVFTSASRSFGHIGPALYGLRTTLLTLLLLALLRIKNPESLKLQAPSDLFLRPPRQTTGGGLRRGVWLPGSQRCGFAQLAETTSSTSRNRLSRC